MACIHARETFGPASRISLADAIEAEFDRHEWSVIAAARRDGLPSLQEPSRYTKLIQRLFGGGFNRRLADPRLEALRRFAVLAWHYGYTLPVSAMKAFKEAGYTLDHIELLLASVSADRTQRSREFAA